MAEDVSIALLARIQDGDGRAAEELLQRFSDRLIALANSRLSEKLARRIDAEDVVQSVYRSFFVNARDGRYTLARGGDLWRLLVGITLHKVYRQAEWHAADKRALDKEQAMARIDESGAGFSHVALAREPTPLDAAVLADEVEHLLEHLPPQHRPVLELRLQGHNQAEIADQLQCSERTVRRVLESLQKQLAQKAGAST